MNRLLTNSYEHLGDHLNDGVENRMYYWDPTEKYFLIRNPHTDSLDLNEFVDQIKTRNLKRLIKNQPIKTIQKRNLKNGKSGQKSGWKKRI